MQDPGATDGALNTPIFELHNKDVLDIIPEFWDWSFTADIWRILDEINAGKQMRLWAGSRAEASSFRDDCQDLPLYGRFSLVSLKGTFFRRL
ncbi:hypothetical protein R1flu_010170 [Riccia fluitans]|uniref:Uncharacterized protein n=1 Tax=Riccia fluitans TaxID=41844 RepID=A0ABD1Z482_9MARC